MVVALLFVIFGVAFDTSAPLLTPSSCRAAVSLLSVQTSVFPRLPAAGPRATALAGAARRDCSVRCARRAGLTGRAGAGSSSHRCVSQPVPR